MNMWSANLSNGIYPSPNSSRCIQDLETFLTPYLRWLIPVLVVAGVIGNGFILIIFNSKGMRTKTHFILSAMAAVDLAHALAAMMTNMYLYEGIIDSDRFSRFYHHRMKPTLMVLVNWLAMTSTWLAVLCTIERFIAIRHPLKAHLMIRKRIIVVATCGITVLSLVVCSYYAFWLRISVAWVSCGQRNRTLYRVLPDPSLGIYGHVARQIHSLLCSVVPIALLFYYNGSVVYYLRRNRDPALQKVNNGHAKITTYSRRVVGQGQRVRTMSFETAREHKVAFVVLAITLTTAFLLLPSALLVIYDAIRYLRAVASGHPIQTPPWYFYVGDISNMLVMLEKVLDFFLYCFASGAFRRRLMAMFLTRPPPHKSSFVSSPRRRVSSTAHTYRPNPAQRAEPGAWMNGVRYQRLVRSDPARDDGQTKGQIDSERATPWRKRLATSISDCSAERANPPIAMDTIWSVDLNGNSEGLTDHKSCP